MSAGKKSGAGNGSTRGWNAAQILEIDKRIRRVILVSRAGEILEVEARGLAPVLASSDELQMSELGTLIANVLDGLASAARYYGKGLYLVGTFEDFRMLVIGPFVSDQLLAIVLPRRVNGDAIYQKVIRFIEAHQAEAAG